MTADTVECWTCETTIAVDEAVERYRDQQGGLHDKPDWRGLWQQVYLCSDCAEAEDREPAQGT